MPNHDHHHHIHHLDDVHYNTAHHDGYPDHHHTWIGNNHFDTVLDGPHDDHDQLTWAHFLDIYDRRNRTAADPPALRGRRRHPDHHTTTYLHRH